MYCHLWNLFNFTIRKYAVETSYEDNNSNYTIEDVYVYSQLFVKEHTAFIHVLLLPLNFKDNNYENQNCCSYKRCVQAITERNIRILRIDNLYNFLNST